jgi:peptidoglycan/xylan/chitin deacetylase (PgdA/CDA1 family)
VAPRPALLVHGHFYQPAREDPFTGEVPRDPSASPAHDWNERIAQEAYAPNAALGNLGRMGWDLGPTVARWLREHRPELHDSMMDQAHAGNVMAQAYHHAILPLASVRDRHTEIRWALRDLELRTGRRPDGLWLPEAAVDRATLRVAAEEGVRWTILAPWQAGAGVDVRVPVRMDLGDGRWIVALFYDAGLSTAVSFDPGATADADRFARDIVLPRLALDRPGVGGGMALICTDGELYGHHQPFRDLFLERLLTLAAEHAAIDVRTPGEWLAGIDARELPEGTVVERTSWSCHHGVARWSGPCGCTADGGWKAPLRQAFDRIAGAIDSATETRLAAWGIDAWAARDRYADVASGFTEPDAWARDEVARAGAGRKADTSEITALMAAQASRLAMFASCGWYWDDPRRLETRQVLRFAAHAVRTVDRVCHTSLEEGLVDDLSAMPVPGGSDGAVLYDEALGAIGRPRPR